MKEGKVVNSNCPEFGYELLSALPYAYNLYLKGELKETISGFDTSCLYFFSPKHTETNCQRSWDNMKKLWDTNFPNINIHRSNLDWDLFSPPPLKEYYIDKSINFEKEKIIIFNRFNKEWGGPPINYLNLNTLDKLFTLLSNDYQVIYINLNKGDEYFDGAKPLFLNDDSILEKHPKVLTIYDVLTQNPGLTYNEVQLRLFSNCTKYISSNGGQLILSAYFGGENIIFSKKCRELESNVNSFYRWYHKLGDGVFQHVNNYEDLIQLVDEKWVKKNPLINILIRTSERPNFFKNCINSIYQQSYKNWNIIVGSDNKNDKYYIQPEKCRLVEYDYTNYIYPKRPNNEAYGVNFKYNLYFNDLHNEVKFGYILYLDDDDALYATDSLERLTDIIKNDDLLVFWRVKFPNRLVPSDVNFFGPPKMKDVSGIGFTFPNNFKPKWEPFKRGDFRIANELYNKIENKIFLNEIITKIQRTVEDGFGRRDDILLHDLSIIIPTYKNTEYIDECINSIITSSKDKQIEILVGIDGCSETLNHIQKNTYPGFVKFYYFNRNLGPYIIRNTLSRLVSSENILFFDSDDVMGEHMINQIITKLSTHSVIRPKYVNFINESQPNPKQSYHGEGVFAIKKDLFHSMNGFEPWLTSADTEFSHRLSKRKINVFHTPGILFDRRVHPNSLTNRQDTGMRSKLRNSYAQQIGRKGYDDPSELHISDYEIVTTDIIIQQPPEPKKVIDLSPILTTQPRKIVEQKIIHQEIKKTPPDISHLVNGNIEKPNIQPESFYSDINPMKTQSNMRQTLIEVKKNQTLYNISKNLKKRGNQRY